MRHHASGILTYSRTKISNTLLGSAIMLLTPARSGSFSRRKLGLSDYHVFEQRTATGSEPFSYGTGLHTDIILREVRLAMF